MANAGSLVASPTSLALEQTSPQPRRGGILLPAASLCRRELVRFLRQRHRVTSAFFTPLLFWVFLGAGMGRSFHFEGMPAGTTFLQFFFPGTVLFILLSTAIFSTISIIEDRKEGFLQSVLVAPVPRMAIVLGKVLGGTILAMMPGIIFLAIAPLVGMPWKLAGFLSACGMMLLVSFSLTALGFCIAWRMTSTQGFHAIMMLLLLPLWFLSGAVFPPGGAWWPIRWLMRINPLTYGWDGLWKSIYWNSPTANLLSPSWGWVVGVSVAFAVVMVLLASKLASVRSRADLQ